MNDSVLGLEIHAGQIFRGEDLAEIDVVLAELEQKVPESKRHQSLFVVLGVQHVKKVLFEMQLVWELHLPAGLLQDLV